MTDTFALAPTVQLTAAARFNHTHVINRDKVNRISPNLDGDFTYNKLNPALGLTWQASPVLTVYGGISESNRAPSPIELGCADPANPCTLPNALAADPFLEQVVTRSLELGLRGQSGEGLAGTPGRHPRHQPRRHPVYRHLHQRRLLHQLWPDPPPGAGTERQRQCRRLRFARRLHLARRHLPQQRLPSGRKQCQPWPERRMRRWRPGRRDPRLARRPPAGSSCATASNLPSVDWRATEHLTVGASVLAYSGQYARGNENNQHRAGNATDRFGETRTFDDDGKLPGYAILNLSADYALGRGWTLFGRIDNVFDQRYATAAALAENPFVNGSFEADPDNWRRERFEAPGTPRAGWIGVRYAWGGR